MTPRGTRPVETVLATYLLATAALLLARHNVPHWALLLGLHVAVAAGLLRLARIALPIALEPVRRLLPLAAGPLFYKEVAVLNDLIFPQRYFDASVMRWEIALFGTQLAQHLRDILPRGLLSEYLHLAYFSYYAIPVILWICLAARRRFDALDEYLTVLGFTFVTCLAWFIAFPVAGPYYTLTPPQPGAMGHVFPQLVHAMVRAGSSQGTAFPSSHVAVSGCVLVMAARWDGRAFAVLCALMPALAVGAVYGGFHYGIDALAGALWCALCVAVGLHVHRALRADRLDAPPDAPRVSSRPAEPAPLRRRRGAGPS